MLQEVDIGFRKEVPGAGPGFDFDLAGTIKGKGAPSLYRFVNRVSLFQAVAGGPGFDPDLLDSYRTKGAPSLRFVQGWE